MTPKQQKEVLAARRQLGQPWHAPPHFGNEHTLYLLTGACFEHQAILKTEQRRDEFEQEVAVALQGQAWAEVHAWVVLPNHYHILACVDLPTYRRWVARLHSLTATRWNGEDKRRGRRVWYRFCDRRIRSERHYYASLNYLHANPVRHRWVKNAQAWRWSSLAAYLEAHGRDTLARWWREYPVGDYGKEWDAP